MSLRGNCIKNNKKRKREKIEGLCAIGVWFIVVGTQCCNINDRRLLFVCGVGAGVRGLEFTTTQLLLQYKFYSFFFTCVILRLPVVQSQMIHSATHTIVMSLRLLILAALFCAASVKCQKTIKICKLLLLLLLNSCVYQSIKSNWTHPIYVSSLYLPFHQMRANCHY